MKFFQKVISGAEMAHIEKKAIESGSDPELFVLEAGKKIASHVCHLIAHRHLSKQIALLVGKGNNGADAWAAGGYLCEEGFEVHAYPVFEAETCSSLNQKMRHLFVQKKGHIEKEYPFHKASLILDGLLGTGFQGTLPDPMIRAIHAAHESQIPILAIDVPSGLNATTGQAAKGAILATETVTLGFLKSGFFLRDGWNHTGKLTVYDFGLPQKWVEKANTWAWAPTERGLKQLLPPLVRNRHKYQAGYVLGVGGSAEFPGALKLAGMGALRGGAGIVRLFSFDKIGECPPELISHPWTSLEWQNELKRANSVFVGPGMGTSKHAQTFLKKYLPKIKLPIVIDAEGLQEGGTFPPQAVLTPHRGEALRLLGLRKGVEEDELLSRAEEFASEQILILKGAPTWVFFDRQRYVIPFGDPGLATAGSGDVLTGLLAALLAQEVKPLPAALLGASLHAMAGEIVAFNQSSYGMIASDIVNGLYSAFLRVLTGRYK